MELAEKRDGEAFNPNSQERDYEELAERLPVFCVSSKAYQKLSGRFCKDEAISGFPDIENTGIPALKRHASKIAKSVRAVVLQGFFSGLHGFLASLMMQVVISDQPSKLAEGLKIQELAFLKGAVAALSKVCPLSYYRSSAPELTGC